MAHFVVDDPLSAVSKAVHHKDVAALYPRIPDMPLVKEKLPVNTGLSELGSKARRVLDALTLFPFAFKARVAGQPVMSRLTQGDGTKHEAGKQPCCANRNDPFHSQTS